MRSSLFVASCLLTTGCLFGTRFEEERLVCEEMVDCLVDESPALAPALLAEYGDDSPCWDNRDAAELCAESCEVALDACENPGGGGGGGGGGDTDDDTTFDPPTEVLVQSVNLVCNDTYPTVFVSYDGWVDTVVVDSQESFGGASATHTLPESANIDFCTDGTCDEWEQTLRAGQFAIPCSQFQISGNRYNNVAVRISASPDTADTAECVIFGRGSRAAYGSECTCSEEWLVPPPADPCGN